MTPKLVIFDCDGVLVDTETITNTIIAADLTARGLPIEPHEAIALFSGGTMRSVGEEAAKRGAHIPPDWLAQINGKCFDELAKGVEVYPGVIDLLDQLETAGIATAVASNGPLEKMQVTLTPSGLFDRLGGRIYSGHDYAPKPQPQMITHAMQVAGVSAAETVFVDDMPAGWRAGTAAGVRTIAFLADGDPDRAKGWDVEPASSMAQVAAAVGVALGVTAT